MHVILAAFSPKMMLMCVFLSLSNMNDDFKWKERRNQLPEM